MIAIIVRCITRIRCFLFADAVILIHLINENTGRNVEDITSEEEMVEKLQNQEIYLTSCLVHQDEHHESRENIAFLKEKIFKKKFELDQDLEFKKLNAGRDVMLAKSVDAVSVW